MNDKLSILDLSPAECTAYETLISAGPLTPPGLAKVAKLTRVNSYAALRGLAQKGLAQEKSIAKKHTYFAEPPTALRGLIRQKVEKSQADALAIESLIPAMMNQYNLAASKPGVSVYEGLDEIKKIYEDTLKLKPGQEVLVLRPIHNSQEIKPFIRNYIKRRAKIGIKNRTITPTYRPDLDDKKLLRQRRYYPLDKFSLPAEVSIYGDKVALISLRKDLVGTIIQSRDISETFRTIYELLWSQAKKTV